MSKGGFRSAIKKGGGGFLNNVDGEVVDYEFTTTNAKGDDTAWVSFVPTFKVDGAEKPVTQHFFVGGADRYEISSDGKSLTMVDESPVTFGFSVAFGKFVDSVLTAAEKAEVDLESELPDLGAGEPLNLEALIGRRFRFIQEVDEVANAKVGKRPRKKDGKPVIGADGKPVLDNRTTTVVAALLGATNGNGKSNGKAATKPSSKKAAAAAEVDADEEAVTYLRTILQKAPVNRKDLRLATAKALMKLKQSDVEQAEAIKTLILDEEWQESQDWLTVDKKGNLSVDE